MDKELEKSINQTLSLGLQQISMLLIESHVAVAKQENKINDEQYNTFREVADSHWDKWSNRVKRLSVKPSK